MHTTIDTNFPKTFHQFMESFLEKNSNDEEKTISSLFKEGAKIWKKFLRQTKFCCSVEKEFPDGKVIKLKMHGKNNTKLWICIIRNDNIRLYSGQDGNLKENVKNFNDIEQCECFVEKQVLILRKKGYVNF